MKSMANIPQSVLADFLFCKLKSAILPSVICICVLLRILLVAFR